MISILFAALWTAYQVDPYARDVYSRTEPPKGGRETTTLEVFAAQGEIESASFFLKVEKPLAKLDLVPGDLKGPSTIPSAAVDVRVVKWWWQDRQRWLSYYNWSRFAKKNALLPNILLHDDAMLKVDERGTNNYLRVNAVEGMRYVCVSEPVTAEWNDDLEQVRDAKTFVPFDVTPEVNRQYWLTFRVPADAKPGVYTGALALKSDGRSVGELALKLEVYPFALPTPRTRHDSSKDFLVWVMNHDSLKQHLAQAKNLAAAEEKVANIYRNMAEHNASPGGADAIERVDDDDLGLRGLSMLQKAGIPLKPIGGVSGCDSEWMGRAFDESGKPLPTPETEPEFFAACSNRYEKYVARQIAFYDKLLGHHDIFCYGSDEAPTRINRHQFPFWDILHRYGLRTFVTAADPRQTGHMVDAADILSTLSAPAAEEWQVQGGGAYSYAAQFFGSISPDHYRREKGIRFWYCNYDGLNEYIWYEGFRWNDFIENDDQYGMFGIVYPVQDGVVDTTAWEAYREGIDDIRYFSLLQLRAEEAMASKDAALAKRGREELAWLMAQDSETVLDLIAFRREVVRHILTLPASEGERRPKFQSPEIKVGPASQGAAVADDKAYAEGEKWRRANRYEVAEKYFRQALASETAPVEDRDRALVALMHMKLELHDRPAALALVEPFVNDVKVRKDRKALVLLEKASAILQPCGYRDAIGLKEVNAAADLLTEAQKHPGQRALKSSIFNRVLDGLNGAKDYARVLKLTEAAIGSKDTPEGERLHLRVVRARTFKAMKNYPALKKEFTSYEKGGWSKGNTGGEERKNMLIMCADEAAAHKDADTAFLAWSQVLQCFCSPKGEGKRYYDKIQGHVAHWGKLAQKNRKFDAISGGDDKIIDLEE